MKISVSPSNGSSVPDARGRFERAHDRRTHRHHPAAASPACVDLLRPGLHVTRTRSLCIACVGNVSYARSAETFPRRRATSDAQRDVPSAAQRASIAASKCSPAVGAATEPRCSREHRLIARLIDIVGRARDVRRQRHATARIDNVVDAPREFEAIQVTATIHASSRAHRLARAAPRDPASTAC